MSESMKKQLILKRDRKTGKWFVRPYLGKNIITGKPLRPYKCFPDAVDEEEAKRAAEAWAAGISKASELNVRRRLDDLLPRYVTWLADTSAPVNTVKTYGSSARLLAPLFRGADPDDVSAFDVELVYMTLRRKGGKRGNPLSERSIRRHHFFLAAAYAWMLERGICTHDPMPYVPKPSLKTPPAIAYSDDEINVIMSALEDILADDATDPNHIIERNFAAATFTSSHIGIREGEACGLNRDDILMRTMTLIVAATAVEDNGRSERQPKTKGKRSRPLPLSKVLTSMLRAHIAWQDTFLPQHLLKGRRGTLPLFCDVQGRRLKPSDLSKWFSALRDALGLPPDSHFHTLRHTFASVLLGEGMDLRTIADLLGHAREGFTLETYAHMRPGRDLEAVEAYAAAVDAARGRSP